MEATSLTSPPPICVAATRTSINQVIRSYIKTMKRPGDEGRKTVRNRMKAAEERRVDGAERGTQTTGMQLENNRRTDGRNKHGEAGGDGTVFLEMM